MTFCYELLLYLAVKMAWQSCMLNYTTNVGYVCWLTAVCMAQCQPTLLTVSS